MRARSCGAARPVGAAAGRRHDTTGCRRAVGLDPWARGPPRQRGSCARHEGTGARAGGSLDHSTSTTSGRPSEPATPSRSPVTSTHAYDNPGAASCAVLSGCVRTRRGSGSLADRGPPWLTPTARCRSGERLGRRRGVRAAARLSRRVARRRRPRVRTLRDAGDADFCRRRKTLPARRFRGTTVEQLPHVAAWREAYRAFGAKPQRTRNSVEALMRRAEAGLPAGQPAHRPVQLDLGAASATDRRRGPVADISVRPG